MYTIKKMVLRAIIGIELLVFFGYYFWGSRGMPLLRVLRAENKKLIADSMVIEEDNAHLQKEIDEWHTYPFYKEKIAREELQFIQPGETVYFMPKE